MRQSSLRRVFNFRGSLLGRIQGDREPVSLLLLLLAIPVEDAIWDCRRSFFVFLSIFFRHDFVRAISLEPLLAETPNSVCCLVLWFNCALLLTIQFASLFLLFFFPPRFCPGHISGTVTRRDFKLSVLLGPAV